jgi:hypothetical protein
MCETTLVTANVFPVTACSVRQYSGALDNKLDKASIPRICANPQELMIRAVVSSCESSRNSGSLAHQHEETGKHAVRKVQASTWHGPSMSLIHACCDAPAQCTNADSKKNKIRGHLMTFLHVETGPGHDGQSTFSRPFIWFGCPNRPPGLRLIVLTCEGSPVSSRRLREYAKIVKG